MGGLFTQQKMNVNVRCAPKQTTRTRKYCT